MDSIKLFDVSPSQRELCQTLSEILSALKSDEFRPEKHARDALDWAETQLSMFSFQKYTIAMLKGYAALLKYTPAGTKNTVEISWKLTKLKRTLRGRSRNMNLGIPVIKVTLVSLVRSKSIFICQVAHVSHELLRRRTYAQNCLHK